MELKKIVESLSSGPFEIRPRGKHFVVFDKDGYLCGVANSEVKAKYIITSIKNKFTKILRLLNEKR